MPWAGHEKKDAECERAGPGRTRGLALAGHLLLRAPDLVFVDESGANRALCPRYGYAPKGATLPRTSPAQPGPQHFDPRGHEPGGPARHDDRGRLHQHRRVPDLSGKRALPRAAAGPDRDHGQLERPQKRGRAREDRGSGCRLWFLPAYSPDFNPIEHAFAKLKNSLRKARARTQETSKPPSPPAWPPSPLRTRAAGSNIATSHLTLLRSP